MTTLKRQVPTMHLCHIDVATVTINDLPEELWYWLTKVLSEDERTKAARFRFEANRLEYISAHALKRLMLSTVGGGKPSAWRFAEGCSGKPIVADRHGPHFNLSHCKGLVACAVSTDVSLGVDIEPIDRLVWLDMASRFFAPPERAWLFGLPEAERARGFIALWTMKEAFVKATGKGIMQGLDGFAIDFDPLAIKFLYPTCTEPCSWHLHQETIGNTHLLGLAWRGVKAGIRFHSIRLEEMAEKARQTEI